jgi:hypothetical protein
MFSLLDSILTLDPATAEFLWTASVSTLLLLAGSLSIWMLPWSDKEIDEVDQSFQRLVGQITIPQTELRSGLLSARR